MPDAPSHDALSARAQEILRRADSQLAALRAPAPPRVALSPSAPQPQPAPVPQRPLAQGDLGQLVDTVEAGIEAARAHLIALSASLERIAQEIGALPEAEVPPLPTQLEGHAKLPSHLSAAAAEVEAAAHGNTETAEEPPAPEAPMGPSLQTPAPAPDRGGSTDAAHEAARLVAIEMAVAGDTREGVGRRLRQEFGIRDPKSILDDAFGPDPGTSGRRSYGV